MGRAPRVKMCLLFGDAVDDQVKVRRGAVLALVEVAVGDDLGVGGEVGVGVHVRHVGGERLAANGEVRGVKDVQRAGDKGLARLVNGLLRALGGAGAVKLGQDDAALFDGGAVVGEEISAVLGAIGMVLML